MSLKNRLKLAEKIKNWGLAGELLKINKQKEMDLRLEICAEILMGRVGASISTKKSKTERFLIDGKDFDVKAKGNLTKKVEQAQLKNYFDSGAMTTEEKDAIKITLDLIAKELKELPEKSPLHGFVYETPSSPTLTIKLVESKE